MLGGMGSLSQPFAGVNGRDDKKSTSASFTPIHIK